MDVSNTCGVVVISMHSTGKTKIPAIYQIPHKITKVYFKTNNINVYGCWHLHSACIIIHPSLACGINETFWQSVGSKCTSTVDIAYGKLWKHLFLMRH